MARDFDDAASDVLDSGGTPDVLNGATSLSVCAWVWVDDNSTEHKVVGQWGAANGVRSFLLTVDASGRGQVAVFSATAKIGAWRANAALGTGAWHHLLATWSQPNTVAIYHDGVAQAITTITDTTVTAIQNAGTPLRIGSDLDTAGTFMDGKIGEVATWRNVVLNTSQASALAKRFSPKLFPSGLTFYAPLIGKGATESAPVSGLVLTATGTTAFEHPPMIYASTQLLARFAANDAAASGNSKNLLLLGVG